MGQFNFEETNLICCYRRKTRAATVAAMTAALSYMETEIQELVGRTMKRGGMAAYTVPFPGISFYALVDA